MIPGAVTVGYLHPGQVAQCFALSIRDLLFYDAQTNQRIVSHPFGEMANECGAAKIVDGRNELARALLDDAESEWLFMVDADMGFAPDSVDRLVASAEQAAALVMGGLAFAQKSDGNGPLYSRRYRCTPTVYRMASTDTEIGFVPMFDYPRDQVVPVDATGAAIVLIHRQALVRVRANHGDHWFDPIIIPHGDTETRFGEDMSFCLRLATLDIPMYVDTSVKTTHDKGGVFYDEEVYDLQQAMLALRA